MTGTSVGRARRLRRVLGEAGPLVALALVLAVVAGAFVVPWLPANPVRGSDLDRYNPVRDGGSYLSIERDAAGTVTGWQSENVRRVPGLRAASQWRSGPAAALDAHVSGGGELDTTTRTRLLERVDALEVTVRETGPEGIRATDTYSVLDAEGQWLLAVHDLTGGTENVLDPPLLVRPRDLGLDATWESTGALGAGGATYRFTGEVTGRGPRDAGSGDHDDCVEVLEIFTVTVDGQVMSESSTRSWSCAGVGAVVHALDIAADGSETTRTLVSTDRFAPVVESLPDAAALPALDPCVEGQPGDGSCVGPGVAGDAATWTLQRVGSAHRSFSADEATVPPVWIPSDPPLVLVAARGGDLVAFDAATGDTAWRFHPQGTIHGVPTYADGRILFGATDKRVYALDTRGLFLWAHRTADSVGTRPVVVGDLVVVGGEDRGVHALDLATGALRWRVATGGPIGSSPAVVDGLVVAGSDDGAVRVIDAGDGTVRSLVDVGDPVVAALAGDEGVAVAATTGGAVVAIEVPSGEVRWRAEVDGAVRAAAAVHGGRVHVVDDAGGYTVLSLDDGREVVAVEGDYVGPALPLDQGVAVATWSGRIELLDRDGGVLHAWDAATASGVSDPAPSFALGPTAGGGRLWAVDRGGILRSLGGPAAVGSAAELAADWLRTLTHEPFATAGSPPLTTPVDWDGRAIGLDGGGNVYATDVGTGETELLGTMGGLAPYAAPIVAGDLLLVTGGESLRAVELPSLAARWEVAGAGVSGRPPVVVGDIVLYASGGMEDDGTGEVRLVAVELATGAERWRAPFGPTPLAGGVVAVGDTVVGGTPLTAYDVASGEVRWRSEVDDEASLGSPGLADETTVVVASLGMDGSDRSTLRAVEGTTGATSWEVDLGDQALDLTDGIAVADGTVVVPTLDGAVLGHRASDGAEAWRYRGPAPIFGNVLVDDDRLWLALENGQVAVLDVATGATVARFAELDFPLESQSRAQAPGRVGDRVLVAFGYLLVGFDAASVR